MKYKEFLNMKNGYTLEILPEHEGDDKESGLIEVPEGAELCAKSKDSPYVFFAKNSGDTLETFSSDHKNKWHRETTLCIDNIHVNYLIVWQRHTQPEELPFIDDEVNQPSHYTSHPSGIECIEITRHHDFAIGNAIKYLWRAGLKNSDNEIQDLEKAAWYIQDKIKQLKGN
ncbi:MAG: DUF3310 domain-containing protein [Acinetobacter sp.]